MKTTQTADTNKNMRTWDAINSSTPRGGDDTTKKVDGKDPQPKQGGDTGKKM